jgi:hypothetical protein
MSEVISGVIGGIIGSAMTVNLMKIPKPVSRKEVISKQTLNPGASVTIKPQTQYHFAIILFHGDGDPEVKHVITVNGVATEIMGNEQAIEMLANETIEIVAVNTSTTEPKSSMTVEILSLSW